MTTISAIPTPLPPSLTARPESWNRDKRSIGTLVYHADPKNLFQFPTGKVDDKGKPVTRPAATIPYELFLHPNHSFDKVEGSFDDAIAAAATWAQLNDVATGVFQASDGVFYTRQVSALYPRDKDGNRTFMGDEMTDYKYPSIDRGLSDRVASVEVKLTHPDLKALVGATSWVDARTGATTVQPAT